MNGSMRRTLAGMLRNWRMLAIAIIAAGVALWSTSSGDWLRLVAVSLVAMGVGLNLVAIGANGGRMPAHTDEIPSEHQGDYQTMNETTRLWYLGDWIGVGAWLISPGDICLYAGLIIGVSARLIGHVLAAT